MANKIKNNEQLFKACECEELFSFAKTKNGIIILMGKFRVSTKTFKTYEDAEEYVKSKPYELLINVSCLIIKLNNENEKNENLKEDAKNN